MKRKYFWSMVRIGSADACWPWTGYVMKNGYGMLGNALAHRRAYSEKVGSILFGMVVRHACDNPICCNPQHLVVGTQKENIADMIARGRSGDCRVFGEKHGKAALSTQAVKSIKVLRLQGLSQQKIASEVGCTQTHVSRILRGENRANG